MSDDGESITNEDMATFLESHPPSIAGVDFHFREVADEPTCQRVMEAALVYVNILSRLYPLQGLDGITYAKDYANALATLDRGIETETVLTATSDELAQGVAMAPAVKRGGKVKTHVVIAAQLGLNLLSEDASERELAVHTLVHELGHVVEHTLMEQALPGVMLSPISDRYEFTLFAHAHSAWSEYVAERIAANFGPSFHGHFQELMEGAIHQQLDEIARVRAAFRWWDKSTSQAVGETVLTQLGKTMTFAGYLFGHADGRDIDPLLGRESLRDLIDQRGLLPWLEDVRDKLRTMFDTRDSWHTLAEHFTLNRALEEGCKRDGVTLWRSPNFAVGWVVT